MALGPRAFVDHVKSLDLPQADEARLYHAYYAARLHRQSAPSHLAVSPADTVLLAFNSLYENIFYTADQQATRDLLHVYGVLRQRGLATPAQLQQTYNACYFSRQFALADQLARRFAGELAPEPPVHVAADAGIDVPSAMQVLSGRRALYATRYALPQRPTVVMVCSPGCHFSRAALQALERDPALLRRFDGALQLLAQHVVTLHYDDFVEWNAAHPAMPMAIAYHWRGWPMLDLRGTPAFYFFKQGRLRHVATGWRDDTAKAGLVAGLDAIGL